MDVALLSARESEVAGFYIDGLSYKEIARALDISPGTVRTHLNSIYRKLEVSSRTELMRRLQPTAAAVPESAESTQAEVAQETGARVPERRQVTFLFADIVGSTELATHLDAEDMRDLLNRFRASVQEVLTSFDGHAAGFPGDGAIAIFGWPDGAETAPYRAASAALAITKAVRRISTGPGQSMDVRVGVATGVVIVEGGAGRAHDFTGAAANLAARLQTVAEPGGVIVSDLTHKLIGTRFETEPLGETELRGIREPVPIFRLLRERRDLTRFETRPHGTQLSPLVGRRQELEILHEAWRDATTGRGGAVLLLGEAGIGKSRLAESLARQAQEASATLLRLQTAEGRSSSPFWPVREAIITAAALDRDAPIPERRSALGTWLDRLTHVGKLQRDLIGYLLDLVTEDTLPEMSASRRRNSVLDALIRILLDLSDQKPLLVLVEDLHWIDPSTLEFVEGLLKEAGTARLLVVMTSRPEGAPEFEDVAPVRIPLSPLNRADAEQIVRQRAGGQSLEGETVAQIIARTDGIPLYLEEVTAAVVDGATSQDAVPATLRESLTARLDGLGAARNTAQIASAIGREVDIDFLEAISVQSNSGSVEVNIARLVEVGLASVARRRITFSHALVQDAAYQSMLRSQRQELHGRIAEAMLGRFRTRFASEPETLAQHLEGAGRMTAAIDYYLRAADAAAARAANREAEGYARRALELAEMLDGGADRDRREIAALLCLGRILTIRYGYGRKEVAEPLRRALDLCQTAGMSRTEFPLVVALTAQAAVSCEGTRALDLADRAKLLADASGEPIQRVMSHYAMAVPRCWRGSCREAAEAFAAGCDAYDPSMHKDLLALGPHDAGIVCMSRGSSNSYRVAPDRKEIERMGRAVALARELNHAHSLAYALYWQAMQACDAGEWGRVEVSFREMGDIAEEHDFIGWKGFAALAEARFAATQLSAQDALDAARHALKALPIGGNYVGVSFAKGLIGDALRRLGRRSEARATLEEAVNDAEHLAARWGLSETLQALARCLLDTDSGDTSGAEAALRRATSLARRQGALLLEIRASTDLAELMIELGDRPAAAEIIEAPLNALSKTAPTTDRERAQAVLLACVTTLPDSR
ncbi:AAA family ATPase [Marimonas sp. MJW-29]|uniref:AAA family ATPase n=1 Tax=Sulfitobacter sediminis TaxID=3234186 RepID=A0ABV3RQH2_9RHOB